MLSKMALSEFVVVVVVTVTNLIAIQTTCLTMAFRCKVFDPLNILLHQCLVNMVSTGKL